MKVNFRVDSSATIGSGHLMRCISLARALRDRGAVCIFIMRDLEGNQAHLVSENNFNSVFLDRHEPGKEIDEILYWEDDANLTKSAITACDLLVVDHYQLDERWERALQHTAREIMVIDDLANRPHFCSILIDQNLGRSAEDYKDITPEACKLLIGPKYAILRDEFAGNRSRAIQERLARTSNNYLVSMGGTDPHNSTEIVLQKLRKTKLPKDIQVTVVLGSKTPALQRIQTFANEMPLVFQLS